MNTAVAALLMWLAGAIPATSTLLWLIGRMDRRDQYTGRHRADLLSTADIVQVGVELRSDVAATLDETQEMVLPDFDDSDVDDYRHPLGAGRYAHLRVDELDWKAERDQALADMGLTLRSPWSTPEELDVWADEREQVPA